MNKKAWLLLQTAFLTFALNSGAAQMKVLGSDKEALQARIDLIKNAKEEILVEYFEVGQDNLTKVGLGLLQDAAKNRNVKVKVLVDAMYSDITKAQFAAMMDLLDAAKTTKNFEIKVFNPLVNLNLLGQTYRNHDKLFVVDGEFAVIGGRNVSGSYFGRASKGKPNLRDVDVLIHGRDEISKEQVIHNQTYLSPRQYFLNLWNTNPMVMTRNLYEFSAEKLNEDCSNSPRGKAACEDRKTDAKKEIELAQEEITRLTKPLLGNAGAPSEETFGLNPKPVSSEALIASLPHNVNMLFMYSDPTKVMADVEHRLSSQLFQLLSVLPNLETVTMVTPYLYPSDSTLKLLSDLSQEKHAKLKILTNSLNSTDSTLVYAAYEKIKNQLLNINTELYEYNGPLNVENQPTILHAKMMILNENTDKPAALIGSFNMDRRSAYINRELGILISGPDVKALTQDMLKEVTKIQNKSTRADLTNHEELLNMASPEKREQLRKDRNHPLFFLPFKDKEGHDWGKNQI